MLTIAAGVLAVALVALTVLDLWAYAQKRFQLSARVVTAELVACVGLFALSIAARDWPLAALWAAISALAAWNLRRTNRKCEAHTA